MALLALVACGEPAAEPPPPPQPLEAGRRPRQLEPMVTVEVSGHTGPAGGVVRIPRRSDHVAQHPCGLCHDTPLQTPADTSVSRRWSHLDTPREHAASLECHTCHDYQDARRLRRLDGSPVSFDHSYQLCAQCHFEQARDWAGGAHGKRLAAWRGERIVETCTGCHDPHAPAFPARMPLRYPQVPRGGK